MIPRQTLAYVICLILVPALLFAQPRFLHGRVVLVGSHDEMTPAEGVDITLREQGDPARTNAQGLFRLFLADPFAQGDKIILNVKKEGWRIQYPLDGEVVIPAEFDKKVIQLRLLPVGSKKFWSDDRIEKFIADTAERAKEQVRLEGKPEEVNFDRYIKEWATQYGFSAQEAKAEIDKWVAEVQKRQDDPHKLGLVAYAEKKFGKASSLFMASAETHIKQLEAVERQKEVLVEKTVRDLQLAGDAAYNNYTFDQALLAYQRALHYVPRKTHPRLWAAVSTEIGRSHSAMGIRTAGTMVHEHLNTAVEAYRLALEVRTRKQLPQDWAMTQNNLGTALQEQGIRTGGEEGRALLAQAVEAYRLALEVYTREQLPQDWAMTQNNLGAALKEQGIRTGGEEGRALLAQAVEAYRLALEVYTREQLPQDWAMTQNNLGNMLKEQGIRMNGEEGRALLAQAVEAYRLALEVYTREQLPQDWAMTQNNLGAALKEQGICTGGEEGHALLAQAVEAYRLALEVYTREQLPQQWAMTQNNLGAALKEQGICTGGEEGHALLAQAVEAYRLALEIYTREQLPQQWAMTQNNLGAALEEQGIRTGGEEGRTLLAQAVEAYRLALEVHTREQLPQSWAMTQHNLGNTLSQLGKYDHNAEMLREAEIAVQAAYAFYIGAGYTYYAEYFENKLSEIRQLIEELK